MVVLVLVLAAVAAVAAVAAAAVVVVVSAAAAAVVCGEPIRALGDERVDRCADMEAELRMQRTSAADAQRELEGRMAQLQQELKVYKERVDELDGGCSMAMERADGMEARLHAEVSHRIAGGDGSLMDELTLTTQKLDKLQSEYDELKRTAGAQQQHQIIDEHQIISDQQQIDFLNAKIEQLKSTTSQLEAENADLVRWLESV